MSSPHELPASARPDAREAITSDRYELDYLLPPSHHDELIEVFDQQLVAAPAYGVTTVYFDTTSRRLLGAALSGTADSIKLRAREYTVEREGAREPSDVWLELKRRSGARTQKHRVSLSRRNLERWVCERVAPQTFDYLGHEGDARALEEYLAAEPELFSPTCVALYRRRAWETEDGRLRLTLDTNISFFRASDALLRNPARFREQLGAPMASEPCALLEVKHRHQSLPPSLDSRLTGLGILASDYSKFVKASLATRRTGTS